MKNILTVSIFTLAAAAAVIPSEQSLGPIDASTNETSSALTDCVIRGYTSSDCTSGETYAWKFVVDGCRSCRSFFNSHSFSLDQGCPSGDFHISDASCLKWNIGRIPFSGPGCYSVDIGNNWLLGKPCFKKTGQL